MALNISRNIREGFCSEHLSAVVQEHWLSRVTNIFFWCWSLSGSRHAGRSTESGGGQHDAILLVSY